MAQTSYQSAQTVSTKAQRNAAYRAIASLLEHAISFDVDMISISWDSGTKLITFTFSDAIPAAQLNHLGLVGPL